MKKEQEWLAYVAKLRDKHDKEIDSLKEKVSELNLYLENRQNYVDELNGMNEQLLEQISTLHGQLEKLKCEKKILENVNDLLKHVHEDRGNLAVQYLKQETILIKFLRSIPLYRQVVKELTPDEIMTIEKFDVFRINNKRE